MSQREPLAPLLIAGAIVVFCLVQAALFIWRKLRVAASWALGELELLALATGCFAALSVALALLSDGARAGGRSVARRRTNRQSLRLSKIPRADPAAHTRLEHSLVVGIQAASGATASTGEDFEYAKGAFLKRASRQPACQREVERLVLAARAAGSDHPASLWLKEVAHAPRPRAMACTSALAHFVSGGRFGMPFSAPRPRPRSLATVDDVRALVRSQGWGGVQVLDELLGEPWTLPAGDTPALASSPPEPAPAALLEAETPTPQPTEPAAEHDEGQDDLATPDAQQPGAKVEQLMAQLREPALDWANPAAHLESTRRALAELEHFDVDAGQLAEAEDTIVGFEEATIDFEAWWQGVESAPEGAPVPPVIEEIGAQLTGGSAAGDWLERLRASAAHRFIAEGQRDGFTAPPKAPAKTDVPEPASAPATEKSPKSPLSPNSPAPREPLFPDHAADLGF